MRAGGDGLARSSEEDGSINADTGLQLCFISFVVVAVRCEVGFDAISIDISVVADIALADDAIVCLMGSAGLAGSKYPKISFIAVALTEFEVSVDATVLIVAAPSIDH